MDCLEVGEESEREAKIAVEEVPSMDAIDINFERVAFGLSKFHGSKLLGSLIWFLLVCLVVDKRIDFGPVSQIIFASLLGVGVFSF